MSIKHVSWAFEQKIPPGPKFVLVALGEMANQDTGECWPGLATVARITSMGISTVRKHIKWLCENGYVRSQVQHEHGRGQVQNTYWVLARIEQGPARFERGAPPDLRGAPPQIERPYKEEPSLEPSLRTSHARVREAEKRNRRTRKESAHERRSPNRINRPKPGRKLSVAQ